MRRLSVIAFGERDADQEMSEPIFHRQLPEEAATTQILLLLGRVSEQVMHADKKIDAAAIKIEELTKDVEELKQDKAQADVLHRWALRIVGALAFLAGFFKEKIFRGLGW